MPKKKLILKRKPRVKLRRKKVVPFRIDRLARRSTKV